MYSSSSSWMTFMIGEWKAMLTRKRVARCPSSFSLLLIVLTPRCCHSGQSGSVN